MCARADCSKVLPLIDVLDHVWGESPGSFHLTDVQAGTSSGSFLCLNTQQGAQEYWGINVTTEGKSLPFNLFKHLISPVHQLDIACLKRPRIKATATLKKKIIISLEICLWTDLFSQMIKANI